MAEQRRGKRKSPCPDFMEVNELDLSPENSNLEVLEPDSKIAKTDDNSISVVTTLTVDTNISNLFSEKTEVNNVTTEVTVCEKKSILTNVNQVTEDIQNSRTQQQPHIKLELESDIHQDDDLEEGEINDEPNQQVLKLDNNGESLTVHEQEIKPDIVIAFSNEDIASIYKTKFIKFLESFIELDVIETADNLTLAAQKDDLLRQGDWVVVDSTADLIDIKEVQIENPTQPKKRRKKSKPKKDKDLFVVDTNPSLRTTDSDLRYASKFVIDQKEEIDELKEIRVAYVQSCFNCGENHALRDCEQPRNMNKIRLARQKFSANQQNKQLRYHLEEDQKYGHLVPGKISEGLRNALGLRENELPPYIYRMRILGYPPGWLEEAKFFHSNLDMFDIHGNNVRHSLKKKQGLNPDRIIDYSGFNVPIAKGVKDAYKKFDVPPYSTKFSKKVMLEYFEKEFAKKQDDFETCDMDVDNDNYSDAEIRDSKYNVLPAHLRRQERNSPSLNDLEQKKKTLLGALDDSSSSKPATPTLDKLVTYDESESEISTIEEQCKCVDEADTPSSESSDPLNTTVVNNNLSVVKESSFGTPILKSKSPYSKLPKPDNFMKDVSPVINFENLPNSTGKYEQMTGVIQKVRNILKHLQNGKT